MAHQASNVENMIAMLAESLERNVLPHVDDHFARLQLRAAREMLLNLGTRVEWRQGDIARSEHAVRDALVELAAVGCASIAPGDDGADNLSALRTNLARVIGQIYESRDGESKREQALTAIWKVVRTDFDAESERIRTGMFS
jgi:hypothetical protein